MTEEPFPDPDRFSSEGPGNTDPFDESGAPLDEPSPSASGAANREGGALSSGLSASLALQMARRWVSKHQEATMLGAFAVGIVLGRLLRD